MNAKKSYYCLIQFCPDPSRAEAVNVGDVLFCPEARFIAARTAAGNQPAAKLVGRANLDPHSLGAAKRAMERRFQVDYGAFQTIEDLEKFVATCGNVLKLTPPRPVKMFDPPADLDRRFAELVGGTPGRRPEEPLVPKLDTLFRKLHDEGRARLDWVVSVPVLERKKLIVVASFESGGTATGIENRIHHVLHEYNVDSVCDANIDEFAAKVEREAHM